ncbi:BadF/BadG/BcrA/BcrD ATPase family protein [Cohnella yongneupensis]|uniref:BadF/BadG/BcrA/BcrD ATPase family protein n=1 Tax=Cohnella yongneupensis TaxID=425006 RepID=A0ABW0QV03_9BACL
MLSEDVIIGIDGGGTRTRVMVCDLLGNVLAYCEKGSASVYRDRNASHNVQGAIAEALELAGKERHHVRGVGAGIAGYDSESDLEWIVPLTELPGLACPKWHVNDAIVAHYGAHLANPGIIVISGTGSIVVGINENGQYLRNYDFHHYAASAARFIAYDAVFEVLAGNTDETDESLVQSMLRHWGVQSLSDLFELARQGFTEERQQRDKLFGRFAPTVTEAAEHGSSLAIKVCNRAISQIKVGIELLAASFANDTVDVAFIGSVINSAYFARTVSETLLQGNNRRYNVVQPKLPPVAGGVLYAMNRLTLPITDGIVSNIQKSRYSRL